MKLKIEYEIDNETYDAESFDDAASIVEHIMSNRRDHSFDAYLTDDDNVLFQFDFDQMIFVHNSMYGYDE